MKYQNELVWLAHQLEMVPVSDEPSLWNAIRLSTSGSVNKIIEKKRHVYISGEPQIVYQMTDLFKSVSSLNDVVTLTSPLEKHPALQWMDITYFPPERIAQLPKNHTVTLFTENRLPFWSRQLFQEDKISNVIATEKIVALNRLPKVRFYSIDEFSYEYLLDDVIALKEDLLAKKQDELLPDVPKQYILQLMAMNDSTQQNERALILDKIAAHMLNTYWLQNHPPFPQWMPILLREIKVFLSLKQEGLTKENLIKELKVWGSRDKRIT